MADLKTIIRIEGDASDYIEAAGKAEQANDKLAGSTDKAAAGVEHAGEQSKKAGGDLGRMGGAAEQLGQTLANQVAPGAAQAGQAIAGMVTGAINPATAGILAAVSGITLLVSHLNQMADAAERARQAQYALGVEAAKTAASLRQQLAARVRLETGTEFSDPSSNREALYYQAVGGLGSAKEGAAVAIEMRVADQTGRGLSTDEGYLFTRGVGVGMYQANEQGVGQFRRDLRRNPKLAEEIEEKFRAWEQTPAYELNMLNVQGGYRKAEKSQTVAGQLGARAEALAAGDAEYEKRLKDDISQAMNGFRRSLWSGDAWLEALRAVLKGGISGETRGSRDRLYQEAAIKRLQDEGVIDDQFRVVRSGDNIAIQINNNSRPDRTYDMGAGPIVPEGEN